VKAPFDLRVAMRFPNPQSSFQFRRRSFFSSGCFHL
jgi:hypothetical protein